MHFSLHCPLLASGGRTTNLAIIKLSSPYQLFQYLLLEKKKQYYFIYTDLIIQWVINVYGPQ